MPAIRLLFLWHMPQPYYKDLVTGQYRLPWVRLHALKDYYGMVKLLDEFPGVHQTFNLVPSLMAQIQDYTEGRASDPFLEVAAKPANDLGLEEKRFALQYLFQANVDNMIGRYPRYRELWERAPLPRRQGNAAVIEDVSMFSNGDITDLQVLSQIAWFDEFFLDDPDIRELVRKGRSYSLDDQNLIISRQRACLAKVLPAYATAAQRGSIEISTSPYYHPILPLVCDTDIGAVTHSGLSLPSQRFRHPEDAREQILRGLDLHQQVFGVRPRGMWPSEGSVSDEVLGIAHELGVQWVAPDEGVLARSLGIAMQRDGRGNLAGESGEKLYQIFNWQQGSASMDMVFRDHSLSDLIGFVYSGMSAKDAAQDFIYRIKKSAEPIVNKGQTPVISVILDGENAWEYYPKSGREFLRQLYNAVLSDKSFEPLTVSEAIERAPLRPKLSSVVPGSWINANFDVWIGAAEDNLAWDYLSAAHDFFIENEAKASPEQRALAKEELLIAEGSDWNWWYGPEHHSANDPELEERYRKQWGNFYHALGAIPPEELARPMAGISAQPYFTPQTAYIHPQIDGKGFGYFDWLGAAAYVADRRSSAMHGKIHFLDTFYAGIDEKNLYCRMDFIQQPAEWPDAGTRLAIGIESITGAGPVRTYRVEFDVARGRLTSCSLRENGDSQPVQDVEGIYASMKSIFECQVPLGLIGASPGTLLRLRASIWQDQLPLDVLPQEGSLELHVVPEDELASLAYAKP